MSKRKTEQADWGAFLRERHLLILEWVKEGQSFEQICRTLSMDPVQVRLISMTPEDSTRLHKRSLRAEVARLTGALEGQADIATRMLFTLKVGIEERDAKLEALRSALTTYGDHLEGCPQRMAPKDNGPSPAIALGSCTCGFLKVINP